MKKVLAIMLIALTICSVVFAEGLDDVIQKMEEEPMQEVKKEITETTKPEEIKEEKELKEEKPDFV
ncbi:MAG: hypothetical protein IIU49_05830, partial [Spirochaetales bacterium]|nr:hypothetical protein [Spirochaetales bacterium]